MNNWNTKKLGDIVKAGGGKIHTGPFGSQLHASDYEPSGTPCIMPANMKDNCVDLSKISFIAERDAKRLSKYLVKSGDIVYSRRGDVTQKALIKSEEAGYFCGTGCLLIRPGSEIDPEFLTYYLSTNTMQNWIKKQAVGATMPNLNTGILASIPFTGPEKQKQKQISAVLSSIDKKIAINNKINTELEAMAKLIYDYWFVQFDFPSANGKPYKSSGGKMFYNEALKRKIPVGWADSELRDYLSLEYGKPLKKEVRTGVGYPVIGSSGEIGFHSSFLVKGPGIVVGRKGTVGAVTYLNDNFYPIDTTYFVKPKLDIKYIFLKYLLEMLGLSKMNSDSAVPGLNRDYALGIKVVFFPEEIIKLFEKKIIPLFDRIAVASEESRELTKLRDWLLPMLMNGQVKVKDA